MGDEIAIEGRPAASGISRRGLLTSGAAVAAAGLAPEALVSAALAQAATGGRPNIVFVLADNVGWGDFSCYGGSIPTPRIDKLASEGIRFNNYTIESQCTPTRTAIITGRQSVRCGTYTVVPGQGKLGLTPWEYGIAKLLSDAGYATSCWGKWHLGDTEGRLPTDQGFDEWWGYRNSVDEAGYGSYAAFREAAKARGVELPKLWAGKKGEPPVATGDLDLKVRPLLDEMIVDKANDYIKRAARGGKPFFAYVALSHVHPPEKAHPDFDQTDPTRLGMYADLIAEMDHRVGQIVDCVDQAGIAENTLFVFSSDNAALCVPVLRLGRFERTLARRLLHAPDRGVHAGAGDGALAGQGSRRDRHRGDAVGARLVQDLRGACGRIGQGADRPADGRRRRVQVPARPG